MRPHRRQPTRLLCPWDSPGENTGVGCHFLTTSLQFSSVTQSYLTLCDPMDCSRPVFPVHYQLPLLKLRSITSVIPSNHLILCPPLLPPSVFPSIRVFSNELVLRIRWPKYWSFSFSISPSSEYSGLISFSIDWLDLLAVQGTLKSLLQDYSSNASILQCLAFFIVQLSHPHVTTGKIALTTQTERVTGTKARGLQMEEIGCKCQTFLSLLSGRRKQSNDIFPSLYKFKRRFLL